MLAVGIVSIRVDVVEAVYLTKLTPVGRATLIMKSVLNPLIMGE
jgi:hypothetical protein